MRALENSVNRRLENSLTRQKKFFGSVDLRLTAIEADFNERGGRGEPLSSSNFVSSPLSDQPLAVTEHS